MFGLLAPLIAKYPQVHLEIFGSGGYASVRDLRASLAPILGQTRFWGQQQDVAAIYPQLDFVVSGLPEKEALGLNLIEAQFCGTPVLAVRAPPFTETVVENKGGYFFTDPREDAGADFERLLERLVGGMTFPRPQAGAEYLAQFSVERFRERVRGALQATGIAA
jgi:glycosyltransferase involved in cell wall biosynthesis